MSESEENSLSHIQERRLGDEEKADLEKQVTELSKQILLTPRCAKKLQVTYGSW